MISVEEWRSRGRTIETPDGRVFAIELGKGRGNPVLAMHGFPTSSWDFAQAIDVIASKHRIVAFDFLDYGLSDKPEGFSASLFDQADIALLVARAFGITRAHVWAHDMSTSVSAELLARRLRGLLPFEVASLVLMNGSVHVEMANLTLGQKLLNSPFGPLFARLNNRSLFKAQIRRIFGRPPSDAVLDSMWDLLARAEGVSRLPTIIRYQGERARHRQRWIGALESGGVPTLVAWGRRDPVAVMAIADRLFHGIPGARRETWDDLGHYPHVEDPARVAAAVSAFWASSDS